MKRWVEQEKKAVLKSQKVGKRFSIVRPGW